MTNPIDLSGGPPPIHPALVEYLELLWPDRFPVIPMADPAAIALELQRIRGCREVVAFLRHHLTTQTKRPQTTATRSPF